MKKSFPKNNAPQATNVSSDARGNASNIRFNKLQGGGKNFTPKSGIPQTSARSGQFKFQGDSFSYQHEGDGDAG